MSRFRVTLKDGSVIFVWDCAIRAVHANYPYARIERVGRIG